MKSPFWDVYCVFYVGSWAIVHLFRWLHMPLPFLNEWLTDFAFLPLTFHIGHWITQYLFFRRGGQLIYRLPILLLLAAYVSVIMEYVAPLYSIRFTSDIVDVLMYFLGTLFYYFFHQKSYTSKISVEE